MVQPTIACYHDRVEAGSVLATELMRYAGQNVAVFGVGAGGVAVAAPIARALGSDLDVLAVRGLSLPGQPDQMWGAAAALGEHVQIVVEQASGQQFAKAESGNVVRERDLAELRHLEDIYRSGRPPERVSNRLVIVVADGLTDLTVMCAAVSAVRRHHPARLVFALPAGTTQGCRELGRVADEVICPVSSGLLRVASPVYSDHAGIGVGDVRHLLSS